jgi:hypothetical protein
MNKREKIKSLLNEDAFQKYNISWRPLLNLLRQRPNEYAKLERLIDEHFQMREELKRSGNEEYAEWDQGYTDKRLDRIADFYTQVETMEHMLGMSPDAKNPSSLSGEMLENIDAIISILDRM